MKTFGGNQRMVVAKKTGSDGNTASAMNVAGLMCGTSVDTIDGALCRITKSEGLSRLEMRLLDFVECPVPDRLKARIFKVFRNGPASLELACSLNFEVAEAFAGVARKLIGRASRQGTRVDAIASHGQTLYHIAPHMVGTSGATNTGAVASTFQAGDPSVIAERTGLPVVANFRTADMAAGGNGAPLVPFADFHLFSRPGQNIVIQNLGGIGNLTFLAGSENPEDIRAFDTGPGNMILDFLVKKFYPCETFDRDGAHARSGNIVPGLMDAWMGIPYISSPPPKSTGRELFGETQTEEIIRPWVGVERPENLLRTAVEFTAQSLALNLRRHLSERVDVLYLSGGGAENGFLAQRIRAAVAPEISTVKPLDETGVPSKARECIAFALLGYARLHGIPGNIPSATGARHQAMLGQVAIP